MSIIIAPSILSSDFGNLKQAILDFETAGADCLHLDVMDGHFVPAITFGTNLVELAKKNSRLPVDAHLMISNPEKQVPSFVSAGADLITFHVEATSQPEKLADLIHSAGRKAGLAINSETSIEKIKPLIKLFDQILVMTIIPGGAGRPFISNSPTRIKEISAYIKEQALMTTIGVDGGINQETGKLCVQAGSSFLVAASYLTNAKNLKLAINSLRS